MKKIFCLAVFCALVTMPVWARGIDDMQAVRCTDADDYYSVDKYGELCLKCNNDKDAALDKTRVYWVGSDETVFSKRCNISPKRFGKDYWTAAEVIQRCANDTCNAPSMLIPGTSSVYICGNKGEDIAYLRTSVIVESSTSNDAGCYFIACDETHPVGSKRDADRCDEGIDTQATKCEQVCVLEAEGSKKANWITYVKECETGMKPARYREYGYTMCELDVNVHGCPPGSSKDVVSKDKCEANQNFRCVWPDASGACLCGKCEQKSALERCLESRDSDEGKACCYLPIDVATWENDACECVDDNMEFDIGTGGRGICFPAPEPGKKFECKASILEKMQTWAKDCATKNPSVVSMVEEISALCASDDVTYDNFISLYTSLWEMNPGACAETQQEYSSQEVSATQTAISDAVARLQSLTSDLDVSKWKTEDGKFNTARLASDSIAGVVLGTAGGLITSNVVKKHQVEDGFEDLNCTIGGQTVAGWGDEFTVGVH